MAESVVETKRSLGLIGGTSMVISIIVGSGIFVSPKGVLQGCGSVGLSLIIWLCGGALTMCSALSIAELGTLMPRSGGAYIYLLEGSHPAIAFLFNYIFSFVQNPAGMGINTLTCAKYLLVPFYSDGCGSPPEEQVKLLAILILLTLGGINCMSGRATAKVTIFFTFSKLAALGLIVSGGIFELLFGSSDNFKDSFVGTNSNVGQIAIGLYSSMWAYEGWSNLALCTEEVQNPSRNLPRAIFIGVSTVTVLYLITNVSYFAILPVTDLLDAPAVAITWAERFMPGFAWVIPIFVSMSTFGTAHVVLFSSGRLLYTASREKHMVKSLAMIHVEKCVPSPAVIVTTVLSIGMVAFHDVWSLMNLFSFVAWLFYALVFAVLLWLRYTRPDVHRPYKVPLVFPVIALLVSIFIVLAPIVQAPKIEFFYALGCISSGLLFYIPFVAYSKEIPGMGTVNCCVQQLLQVCLPHSATADENKGD